LLPLLWLKDRLFYGWVISAVFIIIGIIMAGTRLSFGVFFKSIESDFNLTRATTSLVFSVYMVFCAVFAILGGWALDKYGPRVIFILMSIFFGFGLLLTSQTNSLWQLFITYSLLLALGSGAAFVGVMSTISRWFNKKRGLALGIVTSGAGVGIVVIAPFSTFLISTFDWRIACIALGVIALLIMTPLSSLLKKDPQEIGSLPDGIKLDSIDSSPQKHVIEEDGVQSTGLSLSQSFRTRSLWLLMFIFLLASYNRFMVFTHLVPHSTDIGFSAVQAATVISVIGFSNIAGRLFIGILSDKISSKLAFIISSLIETGGMVLLLWSQGLWMLYLFAVVHGFASGGSIPVQAKVVGETFGLRRIGSILGVLEFCFGIGAAIGPTIGGFIFDVKGSYLIAFSSGAVVVFLRIPLIVLIRQESGQERKRQE